MGMTENYTPTSQEISQFSQFQGGAVFFPNGEPGQALFFHDQDGNLTAPIYVAASTYSQICWVLMHKEKISLSLKPTPNDSFPKSGFLGESES